MTVSRTLVSVILFLSFLCHVNGQIRRTERADFDSRPRYWSWMEPYADQNIERSYVDGYLSVDHKATNNSWSMFTTAYDATHPYSVTTTVIADRAANNVAGGGIVIQCGEWFYMFKIEVLGKAIWVGRWKSKDNVWQSFTQAGPNNGGQPAPSVKGLGERNVLKVEVAQGQCTFTVNNVVVFQKPTTENLGTLSQELTGIGPFYSNSTKLRFDNMEILYAERPLPIVPDAFKGARKSVMQQFAGPGSRYPVISPNGKHLYFIKTVQGANDDIWVAEATSDSTWSDPVLIGKPINNDGPNNVISVSQDGNEVLLWGRYNANGTSAGGGFSTARRTADGWTLPKEVSNLHQRSVATTREECLSPDRKVMIATREVEGATRGGKDLYVSFRDEKGTYGPLTNLGPNVNTPGNEAGPFLAADGRTLYWASSTDTYGSDDIYVSKRLDDTWLNWSPRQNLGPSINTNQWDSYFCIHPNGRYAYVNTSDGFSSGICRIDLPQDTLSRTLLPDPVVVVRGRVLDAKTRKPLSVDISYEDLATSTTIGTAISEPKNGTYSVVLTGGKTYGVYAELDGYFPVSENFPLQTIAAYTEVEKDLYLEPITVGAVIRLNNLFFDTDKSDLRSESDGELRRLIALLTSRPTMKISIEGHTDDRGTTAHNDRLSKARAESVSQWLQQHGIAPSRLTAQGFGKRQPVERGTSDAARQKNRRVDFRIVEL